MVAEEEDYSEPVIKDPRKALLVNIAVAIFCVAVILMFVHNVRTLVAVDEPFSWEAFACYAVSVVFCVGPLGGMLMLRKDLVSIYAAVPTDSGSAGGMSKLV